MYIFVCFLYFSWVFLVYVAEPYVTWFSQYCHPSIINSWKNLKIKKLYNINNPKPKHCVFSNIKLSVKKHAFYWISSILLCSLCYLLILKQVFIYTRKQTCLDNVTTKSTCLLAVISHELLPRLLATGIFPERTFCCQNVKFKVYWLTKKYPVPLYCGLSRQELPTYEKLISISHMYRSVFLFHWKTLSFQ